jgi:carbon-monoxide dehydrogenase large subunit
MNILTNPVDPTFAKFAIGQPVLRTEDPKLLRGEGRYTDDVNLPGQAYVTMVRSTHAHGKIRRIDTAAAKKMPGVLAVYTGAELNAAGYGSIKSIPQFKNRDGSDMKKPVRPALAVDRVRFVGDPVACVIAETVAQAEDAAEAVVVDIEPLPAVTRPRAALQPGAPQLYDEISGNLCLDYYYGDGPKVAEAFAKAAHVTKLRIINSRVVVSPIEPRSAVIAYDKTTERYTVHMGTQGVFGPREMIAKEILKVPSNKVRLLTGNVGGSFGMKAAAFPEYVPMLHGARELGRPVKWTDKRSGSFVSDTHGRDADLDAELALDKDGNFLAVRIRSNANLGSYIGQMSPMFATLSVVKNTVGVYKTPLIEVNTRCAVTNTTPVSSYRGAGRPESNYYMERLVDTAAREMGIDRVELRKRNMIRPDQMPYKTPSDLTYDSGDFATILDRALELADAKGFAGRKAESKARGKLRGFGIGSYLEVTAPSGKELGDIRFNSDGTVTLVTGTLDYGQGHAAPFAQVLSQALGIPFDKIKLLQGDSDELMMGGGTGGSRSIVSTGGAIIEASQKVIDEGKKIAAHVLEASVGDIEFGLGRFRIAGTDRGIGILELAERLRNGLKLPDGLPKSLNVAVAHTTAPSAFPNGTHIAEIEVDPDTGIAEVVKYSMVNDFGTVVNPPVVEGQAHGGIVQGIGQAMFEATVYDEDSGQFLTGSYMDYALPRAGDAPAFVMKSHPVPAKTNPLGAKGCGEAGCAGSLPSVMNALIDALSELGIKHIDMPATPQKIWRAIQEAKKK